MQVREIMTEDPVFCTADEGLEEAALKMRDHDCGALAVVDDDTTRKAVGVITDRDITVRILASGYNPLEKLVADAMTDAAVTTGPDASVEECSRLMEENQIRRVLVVDEEGTCVGIVAQADLARKASPEQTEEVVEEASRPSGKASQPSSSG